MKINRSQSRKRREIIIILVIILVIAIVVFGYFWWKHDLATTTENAKTTSTSPSAQQNYSSGGSHPQATSGSNNQGGAVDESGKITNTTTNTSSSQWTTSTSGLITVKQPISNSVLSTGSTLRGSAKTNVVNYRVVNNVAGVIAQGQLSVVNSNFSGILQFTTKGTSGDVEVFTFSTSTGAEENRVVIPVRFS